MPTTPSTEIRWEQQRLFVVAAGEVEVSWFLELVGRIADAVASAPTKSVLVDVAGLRVALTDLDRYNLGMMVGRRWRGIPYAMVAAAEMVDPRRFGELVAQNRGTNGRLFVQRAEALEWLDTQHLPGSN